VIGNVEVSPAAAQPAKTTYCCFPALSYIRQSSFPLRVGLAFGLLYITLNPKERLPEIQNNTEEKFSTVVIPLKGKIKIDGQTLQTEQYDK
jgi:hypothetical protein